MFCINVDFFSDDNSLLYLQMPYMGKIEKKIRKKNIRADVKKDEMCCVFLRYLNEYCISNGPMVFLNLKRKK